MNIKVFDDAFHDLIDPAAELEIIASEHQFTEGPIWDAAKNRLLYSDIPADTIYSWSETEGKNVYRTPSNFSNGLAFDKSGNLIVCEHRGRAVTLDDGKGDVIILADSYAGFRLNSPNDVIVASDGSILFSDPIYGLRPGIGGPAKQELPFQGVYRLPPDSESLILITDTFERPNGLSLSPDEKKLFIADTVRQHIRVYDVNENWQMTGGEVWVEMRDDRYSSRPDGMKFDTKGNLFTVGPGGIWIFNYSGKLLGRIFLPDKTSNLAWGEENRKTLFITSSDKVYRLRCITHG